MERRLLLTQSNSGALIFSLELQCFSVEYLSFENLVDREVVKWSFASRSLGPIPVHSIFAGTDVLCSS